MKSIIKFLGLASILFLISCNSRPSLQEYFVDHQEDQDFVSVDISASLLDTKKINLSQENRQTLKSIKKVNFLALPLKEQSKIRFDKESVDIAQILKNEKYQTLMKFKSNGTNILLKYTGEDEDIDEVIVFAKDQKKGLALIRVLGDNMRPEKIVKLAESVEKGNIDLEAFKDIAKIINNI